MRRMKLHSVSARALDTHGCLDKCLLYCMDFRNSHLSGITSLFQRTCRNIRQILRINCPRPCMTELHNKTCSVFVYALCCHSDSIDTAVIINIYLFLVGTAAVCNTAVSRDNQPNLIFSQRLIHCQLRFCYFSVLRAKKAVCSRTHNAVSAGQPAQIYWRVHLAHTMTSCII